MTDEPRSPADVADAEVADLMTRFVLAAFDDRKTVERAQIAARIETAAPGAMQRLAGALDLRKVRLGRVTLQ